MKEDRKTDLTRAQSNEAGIDDSRGEAYPGHFFPVLRGLSRAHEYMGIILERDAERDEEDDPDDRQYRATTSYKLIHR